MKWECNDYDMTMYEWAMSHENEKWNENENGMWTVVETECNGYDMNMCAMACAIKWNVNCGWNRMEWLWHDNMNMCAMIWAMKTRNVLKKYDIVELIE